MIIEQVILRAKNFVQMSSVQAHHLELVMLLTRNVTIGTGRSHSIGAVFISGG